MNLILIAGLPASGKSRFAVYVGKELGIPVIVKDEIKEILFDGIGFQSRAEKVKLGDAAMNIMYYMANELMARGHSVILDNNFEACSVPGLKRLLVAYPCRLITVRFDGDIRAIYQRFIQRDQDPDRHRGHIVNTVYPEIAPEPYVPIPFEEFERKFRERGMLDFTIGGRLITVDTTSFKHYSNEELLSRLRKEME